MVALEAASSSNRDVTIAPAQTYTNTTPIARARVVLTGCVARQELRARAAHDGAAEPAVVLTFGDVEAGGARRAPRHRRAVQPRHHVLLLLLLVVPLHLQQLIEPQYQPVRLRRPVVQPVPPHRLEVFRVVDAGAGVPRLRRFEEELPRHLGRFRRVRVQFVELHQDFPPRPPQQFCNTVSLVNRSTRGASCSYLSATSARPAPRSATPGSVRAARSPGAGPRGKSGR